MLCGDQREYWEVEVNVQYGISWDLYDLEGFMQMIIEGLDWGKASV
jgi:hypothetical protein